MAAVDIVETSIPHLVPTNDGEVPYIMHDPDLKAGQALRNFTPEPIDVEVENIRGKEYSVSLLDTAGFQFFRAETSIQSFDSKEEIERVYYPESIDLMKRLTGANRVVIFDHSKSLESHSD